MKAIKTKLKLALLAGTYKQKGFALPLVLGVGLATIIVGAAVMVRSQSNQLDAIAQKQTSQAMQAAELGVSRLQKFLDENRSIATYDMSDWVNVNTMDNAKSREFKVLNDSSACPSNTASAGTTIQTRVNNLKTWQSDDIPDYAKYANNEKPQYKLVDYKYQPQDATKPNSAPGIGILTVQGKVGEAESQIEVTITVLAPDTTSINYPLPGMWISSNSGAKTTKAHVLAKCGANSNFELASGYTQRHVNADIPPAPPKPTTKIAYIPSPSGLTLPRATDITNKNNTNSNYNATTGAYQYEVASITDNLTITPGEKVHIWVNGDIDLQGGQKRLMHSCTGVSNCSPTDAKIIGLAANGSLHLGGNASICDIMFWAPTYSLDINGGGQAQGCGGGANNNGIYWLKKWGDSSSTTSGGGQGNHVALEQTSADWEDILSLSSVTTNFIEFPPKIGAVCSWSRQNIGSSSSSSSSSTTSIPSNCATIIASASSSSSSSVASSSSSSSSVASSSSSSSSVASSSSSSSSVASSSSSSSVSTCTVPSITGLSIASANLAITNAGLIPAGTSSLSTGTKGVAKSQSPSANSPLSCGSTVSYQYRPN